MVQTLDIWFEFASTYSYPAVMRVEGLAKEKGVPIRWRPFLLGPIFAGLGMNDSPFNLNPVKGDYMWRDLERICQRQGLAYRKPSQFPRGSLAGVRVATAAVEESWVGDFIRAVYRKNFAEDADIGDRDVIAGVLESLNLSPEAWLEKASRDEVKAAVRQNTEEAQGLKIFGAPTFMVGSELFWGNDRLEDALDWALTH